MNKVILNAALITLALAIAPPAYANNNPATQGAALHVKTAPTATKTARPQMRVRRIVEPVTHSVRLDKGSYVSACNVRNLKNQRQETLSDSPGFRSAMPVIYRVSGSAKMRYSKISQNCETRRRITMK